ncbi:MAG: family 16 glycosylhydrolase [Rhodococcus sp.]|nr:family 16 glycosylhydrolase [Rhodococcus sp. (in: high G+C Gram-positive bacteria)]
MSLAGLVLTAPAQAQDTPASVRSQSTGLCVDNRWGVAEHGNPIQLYECNGTPAQLWTTAPDGTARVQGFCLQPVGGVMASGRELQIARCTGVVGQQWQLAGDGTIRSRAGNLCVAEVSGTPRMQRCASGNASQKWTVTLDPTTPPGPNPPGQPSGVAMPTGNLPGWRHIFADDFTLDAPTGSWANDCSPDNIVYTGAQGQKWRTYPRCYRDTYQQRPYRPDAVLSVRNGVLDFHLRRVDGIPAGANPSPLIDGVSQYQTYGRYSARMRVTKPGMSEYYVAWLLWPQSERWPVDGEFDFPEGPLNATAGGFHHYAGAGSCVGCQAVAIDVGARFTDWHTYTIEWSPGRIRYLLDDAVVLDSTDWVPSGPMRWQLQTETNGNGNSNGNLEVDWVSVWAYNG